MTTSETSKDCWTEAFPGNVEGVVAAARWLDAVAAAGGFPEDLGYAIQLCVEELFTNAVRHGGPQAADGGTRPIGMRISLTRTPGSVTVVLQDDGTPFDVTEAPARAAAASLQTLQPGGLGIQLIRTYADALSYDHVGGFNRTTLKFRWPESR